jgi:hypothetical protein
MLMMTYKEYKAFWDNFLQKWMKDHVDFIMNDPDGQAFFPKNSQGNLIQTDLYKLVSYFMKSVPLGMYCLMSPFAFSLAPRSQEWYGVQK